MKFVWGIIILMVAAAVGIYTYGRSYSYESEMYHFCKDVLQRNLDDSQSLIVDEVIVTSANDKLELSADRGWKSRAFDRVKMSVSITFNAKNAFGANRKNFTVCHFAADFHKNSGEFAQVQPISVYVGIKKINYDDPQLWYSATGDVPGILNISGFSPFVAAYDLFIDKANFLKPGKVRSHGATIQANPADKSTNSDEINRNLKKNEELAALAKEWTKSSKSAESHCEKAGPNCETELQTCRDQKEMAEQVACFKRVAE